MQPEFKYTPIDIDTDRAVGIKLPFNKSGNGPSYNTAYTSTNTSTGVFSLSYTTEEQAHSNLKNLILTRKGERIYHPTFGCSLHDYLFENVTDFILEDIEQAVREDINTWLPYINIIDLRVQQLPYKNFSDNTNGFVVSLQYNVLNNNVNTTIKIFIDNTGIEIV